MSQAPDLNRFWNALHLANIDDFVNKLAIKEKTKIGILGMDLSQGQRQRILLARVFYKNPDYIFFDEATNALDTENEKIIMNNILIKIVSPSAINNLTVFFFINKFSFAII